LSCFKGLSGSEPEAFAFEEECANFLFEIGRGAFVQDDVANSLLQLVGDN
jgi:hypothetical protein